MLPDASTEPLTGELPKASVIVLCRNEAGFIAACLDSLLAGDYPGDRLEILVVDGMSEDGTRAVVEDYVGPTVKMLDNPARTTPVAINIGISRAEGDVVAIVSAHASFDPRYLSECVGHLFSWEADVAGPVAEFIPRAPTTMGRAVALALAHPFGGGAGARYKTGSDRPRWVDTAFCGVYRREVFEAVGTFNEALERSQDMDYSLRMRKAACKILVVPTAHVAYYVRSGFGESVRYNFTNGFWAVYPLRFGRVAFSWRHLVPLGFVSALIGLGVGGISAPLLHRLFGWIAGAYVAIAVSVSVTVAGRKRDARLVYALPIALASLHAGYGLGSLWAVIKVAAGRISEAKAAHPSDASKTQKST